MVTSSTAPVDNDMSVATPQTGNCHTVNAGDPKEYVVKFLFRPKGRNNNTEVARTHYAILRAIIDIYLEVQVFDNFGTTMREFPSIKSYDAYLRHYKLQFVKANENKNRQAIYLVFHQIRSPIPLGEIRRHATIAALLQKVNTRLSLHYWTEDDTRIANLGFFVGFDPRNILREEMEERVRQDIHTATKRALKTIPRLATPPLSALTHMALASRPKRTTFSVANTMLTSCLIYFNALQQPIFIFYKIHHKNPDVYRQSICSQNSFLSTSRVIPIQGISEDVMFYVARELRTLPAVTDVAKHRLTMANGR